MVVDPFTSIHKQRLSEELTVVVSIWYSCYICWLFLFSWTS